MRSHAGMTCLRKSPPLVRPLVGWLNVIRLVIIHPQKGTNISPETLVYYKNDAE